MDDALIRIERQAPIATIFLNRPQEQNTITIQMMDELVHTLEALDVDEDTRAVVLTGSPDGFCSGADIQEMAEADTVEMYLRNQLAQWDAIRKFRKPMVAAVSGYAIGGGCELALMCDLIVASETAVFAHPEVSLGIIPGAGGTQWLARLVGKATAMEMILAGRHLNAQEALKKGLVNRVVSTDTFLGEAQKLAQDVAQRPPVAVMLAKEAILSSFDNSLQAGLDFERKCFYMLFSSKDKQEGMQAFMERRKPKFHGD